MQTIKHRGWKTKVNEPIGCLLGTSLKNQGGKLDKHITKNPENNGFSGIKVVPPVLKPII